MSEHIARARIVADRLRELSQIIDEAAWNLDAELSAIDKDEAGYREKSAANPDGAANAIPGDLEAALFQAQAILIDLGHWAENAHLPPQAVALGGTYGRWYVPTLDGLDKALAAQRANQIAGRVTPVKIIRAV